MQKVKLTARVPEDVFLKVVEVSEKYNISVSSAVWFLLECGLDVEQNYKPFVTIKSKSEKKENEQ